MRFPIRRIDSSVKNNRSSHVVAVDSCQDRLPSRRAYPNHGDASRVRFGPRFQVLDSRIEILQNLSVSELGTGLAPSQSLAVAGKTPIEIRRQHDVAGVHDLL